MTEDKRETYAPSYWEEDDDDWSSNAVDNIDKFNEELPDIEFEVELYDGTSYVIDDWDAFAVLMKYDWETVDEFIDGFRDQVQQHFESKTEPTKFGAAKWGRSNHDESQEEYASHSELAPVVLYPHIRTALMQIGFMAMSDEGEDPVEVIGIDDNGSIHHYGEHGRVTFELKKE